VEDKYLNVSQADLEALYASASQRLKSALLDGSPWEEMQELRHHLTELVAALHSKRNGAGFHPAAFQKDNEGMAAPGEPAL